MVVASRAAAAGLGRVHFRDLRRLAAIVPALFLAALALAWMAYLFAFLSPIQVTVGSVLPIEAGDVDPTFAILSAVGLGALSLGLLRAKEVAWWLALATFLVALLVKSDVLQRPVPALVVVGVIAVLVADRGSYTVQTDAGWRRIIVGLTITAFVAIGIEAALGIFATGTWPAPLSAFGDATSALGGALGIGHQTGLHVLRGTSFKVLIGLVLLLARLPMVLAAIGVLAKMPEPSPDALTCAQVRGIAERFGAGALLPFQLGDDKLLFSAPDIQGCLVYGMAGRTAVILGDPIGSEEGAKQILAAFVGRSRTQDREPVVYQASAAGMDLYHEMGFRGFRVGHEAIVDLRTFDLAGPRRANLRHTITRCRKAGVSILWFDSGMDPDAMPRLSVEMEAIDRKWRRHVGPEMGFTISRFRTSSLAHTAVSVAVDAEGRALGFATFRPTGIDGGWVLDLMRRADDSPPGVVEASIAEAALKLRDAGAAKLSLGLAPLFRLDPHGPFEERLLQLAGRAVGSRYDVQSLAFFKGKFDPVWIPRYGATRHRRDIGGYALALLRVHVRPTSPRSGSTSGVTQ